jgi:hypothetical protein
MKQIIDQANEDRDGQEHQPRDNAEWVAARTVHAQISNMKAARVN